jgi:Maltose acetyltransferase
MNLLGTLDPELVAARMRARDLCQDLNATRAVEQEGRRRILRELFSAGGDTVWMEPPFFCDYGSNIELGERVFFNSNCVILDVCPVHIGSLPSLVRQCRSTHRYTRSTQNCGGERNWASRWRSERTCGLEVGQSSCQACGAARRVSLLALHRVKPRKCIIHIAGLNCYPCLRSFSSFIA